MDLMTRYFDDAMRIYAICGDEDLSDHDARLLTYMHAKGCESGKGIDYFDDPSPFDEAALSALLGETVVADTMVTARGEVVTLAKGYFSGIGAEVGACDHNLEKNHGMERRLSGELANRLRLYRDAAFRQRMVSLYREKITPKLSSYDKKTIDRAFSAFRERLNRTDHDTKKMLAL
jgi:hypothetical protein